MSKHICKIEVFLVNHTNQTQYRCDICDKYFSPREALNHVDRVLGLDEWRRLRHTKEMEDATMKMKIKEYKKLFKGEVRVCPDLSNIFGEVSDRKYIKIS